MEARRRAEATEEYQPLGRTWCVGSEPFREQMLRYIEQQRGRWHYGAELAESAQAKAERLIAQGLQAEGIPPDKLASWRKGHPFKVKLAARLRTETTVTVAWIARRLGMGTRGHLAHLLQLNRLASAQSPSSNQQSLNL